MVIGWLIDIVAGMEASDKELGARTAHCTRCDELLAEVFDAIDA